MDKKTSEISEIVASQYALEFLRDYTGDELFLGSDIEQLLAERSIVIYQDVQDQSTTVHPFVTKINTLSQSILDNHSEAGIIVRHRSFGIYYTILGNYL